MIGPPVFLVGAERSGTTLLRLMLDHHPEIAFNLESEFMVTRVSDIGAFPDMGEYVAFLSGDRVFQHSHFSVDASLDYKPLLNDFLSQKLSRDSKEIVGATVHYQFGKLEFVWPDARYIYLFRDGRDVANSVMKMGWAGNTYCAADVWLEAEREWFEVKERLPDDRWLEVQYEQLTAKPKEVLERICSFIGVPFSEHMFDYVEKSTYEMPDPTLNYQWKRKMSVSEVQLIEGKIGVTLVQRGYPLSGVARISISRFRQTWLRLDSRLRNYFFKINRYGIPLVLSETFFRRFGLTELHRKIRMRINSIDEEFLR